MCISVRSQFTMTTEDVKKAWDPLNGVSASYEQTQSASSGFTSWGVLTQPTGSLHSSTAAEHPGALLVFHALP